MQSTRLSIVMFSALLSHGGGRETWLNNVLPKLAESRRFSAIDVYFVGDDVTDVHNKIPSFGTPGVRFIETRLPATGGKLRSLRRIAIFLKDVPTKLRAYPDDSHCIVAIGTFYEGAVLALLRMLGRRPPLLVAWIRGIWSKEVNHRHGVRMRDLTCAFEKFFLRSADKLISNGQDTKQFYEALLERHVEAIPNALDIAKYAAIQLPAFSSASKVISYIGRLSEEKGLRVYLEAIELYLTAYPASTVNFDIVGDGPLRVIVEQFVSRFPERVRYLGPLANERMLDYLETIDVGVCLTFSKKSGGGGVSNGLLELIGAGRLVIAWDSVIFKQVLNSDQALFVEEDNAALLATAFADVERDPAGMSRRIAASAEVLQAYSLERHVDHFLDYTGF